MTTMSNDKTAEEIHDRYCAGVPYQLGLREASINAMKAYSAQQLKEYKEKLKSRIIFWNSTNTEDEPRYSYKDILELIDQTDSTK